MRSAWGLEVDRDMDWRQRTACTPADADMFWPTTSTSRLARAKIGSDTAKALAICHSCPVQRQCYQHAATHPEPFLRIAGGRVWHPRGGAS
jgi:transcription factor WhiB